MLQRWRTMLCSGLVTLATLGAPSWANAHPCNNDWIIFILLWMMFGGFAGGPWGNGAPAGPGGCWCPPGGQPVPAPAPVPPAPNGNGNGNGHGHGNGALGGAALRPAMRQPVPNIARPAPQPLARPAAPNGQQPQINRLMPAPGGALRMPMNPAKPANKSNGKADANRAGPAALMPAFGGKPILGKPKAPEAHKPAIGGKPAIGAKPPLGGAKR
ncbi:MAG: hypothetical protein RMJ19_04560 [Gemmatales bacterium]|nr:hypothetical protein [Gemmatales bacterium]MDW8174921.1 hypothetical protein [Gemmatales bacterium]